MLKSKIIKEEKSSAKTKSVQNRIGVFGSSNSAPTFSSVQSITFENTSRSSVRKSITRSIVSHSSGNVQISHADFEPSFNLDNAAPSFQRSQLAQRKPVNLNYQSPYRDMIRPLNNNANQGINRSPFVRSKQLQKSAAAPAGGLSTTTTVSSQDDDLRQKLKIKVIASRQFYDDERRSKVPVYGTHSKNRGTLLLINNIKFVSEKHLRIGAEVDEKNVKELFSQIGFKVIAHRNLNRKQMEKQIAEFRNTKDFKTIDIMAVIVMSHGVGNVRSDSTQVVTTDEHLIETAWIINQFNSINCPLMVGKPKIFLFQCCRGNQIDVQHDAIPFTPRQISDMLIAYSTVPGFVSHRDPKYGTWYIQAICKVFMEHAHDTDVENLLKMVDHKLLHHAHSTTQTSSFENRGFKTCYLHPGMCKKEELIRG